MEKFRVSIPLMMAFCLTMLAPGDNVFALENANIATVVLTPGHSRTIYFDVQDTVLRDPAALHATLIMTTGAGLLNIGIASSGASGDGSEIVYGVAGFIGSSPVLDYSYSTGVINLSLEVPDFSVGILFTGAVFGIGEPEFPYLMSMMFSLF